MRQLKPASLIVRKDILFKITSGLAFASYLFTSEKRLCLVFKAFHEALCLEMRLETHRGPNLLLFFSGSHIPGNPLGFSWLCINIAVLSYSLLEPVFICAIRSEIHPGRAQHLGGVAHLRKAFAIVVCFLNRLLSHLFNEGRYSILVT